MKRMLCVMLLTASVLWGISPRNWQVITNTARVYDAQADGRSLYLATWGGLQVFDLDEDDFVKTYTPVDGLSGLSVKCLDYLSDRDDLLIGMAENGVDQMIGGQFDIAITENLGLASPNINDVAHYDSLLFIATDKGVNVFVRMTEFPYPILQTSVTTVNGLSSVAIEHLTVTMSGKLVCCGDNGLDIVAVDSLLTPSSWHHYSATTSPLPSNTINSLSTWNDRVAVATNGGLLMISDVNDTSTWINYNEANGNLAADAVYAVYLDSDGAWFAYGEWNSYSGQIVNPTDYPMAHLSYTGVLTQTTWGTGFRTNQITSIGRIDGKLYATTWGCGFYLQNGSNWVEHWPNGPNSNVFTTLTVDSNNVLWTGDGNHSGASNADANTGVASFDGTTWENYRMANSGLTSPNVIQIGIDNLNRKWFSCYGLNPDDTVLGLTVFDDATNTWQHFDIGNDLANPGISVCALAPNGNMLVGSYGTGGCINEVDSNFDIESQFLYPISLANTAPDPAMIYFGDGVSFYAGYVSGLHIYAGTTIPYGSTDSAWNTYSCPNDINGKNGRTSNIYMLSRDGWYGKEYWFACDKGLFKWVKDTNTWYQMTVSYKRQTYDFSSQAWTNGELYYSDEQRLYGAVATSPSAMLIDPFDRIWIGTQSNGITMYDPSTDRYMTYNMSNCPLVSNTITSLAYEPHSGRLYIGTNVGLNAVEIGKTENDEKHFYNPVVYPNPFHPSTEKVGGNYAPVLTIVNGSAATMPKGKMQCHIYNMAGEWVVTLDEDTSFNFTWDGTNKAGKECGSGVYFFVISGNGEAKSGKFALIR